MKKTITLCLFVFALFLGTQTAVAQNSNTDKEANAIIEAKAIKTTKGLIKFIQLEKDKTEEVYKVVKEHTSDLYFIENEKNSTEKEVFIKTTAANEQLDNKMKVLLNKVQFERFKRFQKS
ncbi:hypothetical protein ADIWIN_2348 [Winogradskyella psychrotolerans RS-3]|uniref:Uncharacterized protein n=1 Tax=Winogradskyella psychrotolerans RS-3 TaxID=641526 RepID=S7VRA6_9FLAO|nr:hypothetical protein [Winogradskyella psychrotolerans]EPR72735.1 hypothetical protein ADIWIN_2348 [Winogradskyella psychrotolerans RS-3]